MEVKIYGAAAQVSSAPPGKNQRGGAMPKDPAENQDQYKIRGGFLNEYELNQGKGAMEEQSHPLPDDAPVEGLRGAAEPGLPENVAERIRQVEERAHEIVERRRAKQGGGAVKAAKKPAKRPAQASKKAAKGAAKGAARKGAAKKGAAAKKGGGSKGAAKKGAVKVGAKKSAAKKVAAGKGGAKVAAKKVAAKKGAVKKGAVKKGAAKKGGPRR